MSHNTITCWRAVDATPTLTQPKALAQHNISKSFTLMWEHRADCVLYGALLTVTSLGDHVRMWPMAEEPMPKRPARPTFGRRGPVAPSSLPPKRSTAIALVLAGSAVFFAYNVRFHKGCTVPPAGGSPELMAEYERCRANRWSSSSRSVSSTSWGTSGSSSRTTQSTARRGGFGSTSAGHSSASHSSGG
jgi:hypothetical protein